MHPMPCLKWYQSEVEIEKNSFLNTLRIIIETNKYITIIFSVIAEYNSVIFRIHYAPDLNNNLADQQYIQTGGIQTENLKTIRSG